MPVDYGRPGGHVARDHVGDAEEDYRQQNIHAGTGREYDETLPRRLRRQALRVGRVFLTEQADKPTEWKPVDGVDSAAPVKPQARGG